MKINLKWMLDKRFLGFIGLLALSVVIWFGGNYVRFGAAAEPVSPLTRLVVILAIWVIWGLSLLIGQFRQSRRNQAMVEDIVDSGTQESISDEESRKLTERFQEAMAQLRKARFQTRSGLRSLYQMPWYIIVGPPGAGKTTALINSGLRFPLLEKTGQHHLQGVGGTRHCDWWFTDEAVLIDTAGRYTTQDSDSERDRGGWQQFLALLGKYRPRRPVNGVIIAVSVHELMTSSRVERQERAAAIRTRIQELMTQFHTQVPVYVWFTKVDLVAGFSEFFEDMTAGEREQVWGMTFPAKPDQDASKTVEFFGAEYEALMARLNDRVMQRLQQERELSRRSRILMFPAQMASLENTLQEFLGDLFTDSRYDQPIALRGLYFTSGTQEGRPIDRVLTRLSAQYGLDYVVDQNAPKQGRSYFLTHLLRDVIFPEAEMGGVNARYERRQRVGRMIGYAAIAALFIAAVGVWSASLLTNRSLMTQVSQHINTYQNDLQQNGQPQNLAQAADRLAPLYQATQVYRQVQHPWLSSLGLYNADVQDSADAAYRSALDKLIRPQLVRTLENAIASARSNEALYDDTRIYLMLAEPEHRTNADVLQWFEQRWSQDFSGQATRQAHLVTYLGDWLATKPGAQATDKALLATARARLSQVPIEERIYRQIQHQPQFARRLDMSAQLGLSASGQFKLGGGTTPAALQIPWLYTKAGYKALDLSPNSDLVRKYSSEQWILDAKQQQDFTDADVKKIVARIRSLYFADYVDAWEGFLKALSIAPMHSLTDSGQRISDAGKIPTSSLYRVLQQVDEETRLVPRPPALKAGGSGKSGVAKAAVAALADKALPQPTPVDTHFASLHDLFDQNQIGGYFSGIAQFGAQIQQFTLTPNAGEAAYRFAKARFSGQGQDPLQALRLLATKAPGRLGDWLQQLADDGWQQVLQSGSGYLSGQWKDQVYSVCENTLASAFPFKRKASNDDALNDFASYFAPGGIEQQFVQKSITPFLSGGRDIALQRLDGQSLQISRSALTQIARARDIRNAFFRNGKDPQLSFSLTPENLDKTVRRFQLELGSQSIAYSHGPQLPTSFNWPDKGTDVSVLFEDINGTLHRKRWQGDWGLFRLLEDSQVKASQGGRLYHVTINVDGRKVVLRLKASSTLNPYQPGWLGRYQCLSQL